MFSIQSIDAANVTVRRLTGWMMAVSKARFAALVNHFGGDEQLALEAMIDDNKAPAFSQVNETFVPGEYDGVLVSNNGEGNALRVAFSADSVAFWAPGASADENPLFFDKHPHTWAGNRWVRAHAPQGLCAQSPVDAFTFMGRMPEPALSLARSSSTTCNLSALPPTWWKMAPLCTTALMNGLSLQVQWPRPLTRNAAPIAYCTFPQ